MTRHVRPGIWAAVLLSYFLIISLYFAKITGCCPCPYQGATDAASVIQVINMESVAVREQDLGAIRRIFAPDAVIMDVSGGKVWKCDQRYATLFANTRFLDAAQGDFQPAEVGTLAGRVVYTTSSSGRYVVRGDNTVREYNNPPGSNEWTLKKTNCGCWVVTQLRFNIPVK